jgi:beta-lactamase superfamily II metal-dependent hydrolase
MNCGFTPTELNKIKTKSYDNIAILQTGTREDKNNELFLRLKQKNKARKKLQTTQQCKRQKKMVIGGGGGESCNGQKKKSNESITSSLMLRLLKRRDSFCL